MRAKSLVAVAFLVVLVTGLAAPAGAGGGGGGACGALSDGASLAIRDFCFDGAAHVSDPGQTVHVINYGEVAHDLTAADGSFASGLLEPGETFNVEIGSRGVVQYYCSLHGSADGGGMAGVLVSEGADTPAVVVPEPVAADGASAVVEEAEAADPASSAAMDTALVAATNAAQSDATVALVVVTIIGMAVAFGLGLVVWVVGRLPSGGRPIA
ncbi:MAG: hypothetical protein WD598_03790 [Acidimicrobiia bacterium]